MGWAGFTINQEEYVDYLMQLRFETIERRLAILEGKPDPGLYCARCSGKGEIEDYYGDYMYENCNGTGRIYT